jgi:transcription elongation factor Elf1
VILFCTIDAKEGQDIALCDVPGAFMQADIDEITHIWLEGWRCANSQKQQLYKTKAEVSSPTVADESVMFSCTIDAKEGWDIAVCDIPGAFMPANMYEIMHNQLDGDLADLLCKIDPGLYEKYMVKDGQHKSVIHLCLSTI